MRWARCRKCERWGMGRREEENVRGGNGMEKRTIIKAVICVVLMCFIWGGYFFINTYHIDRMLDIAVDDFSWVYQVDSVETKDGEVLLKGFAFELDKDAIGDNYEIVLQELETGKNYFFEMEYSERKDVNDYFLCEYDYLQSGFEAKIVEEKIDLQGNFYEVLLRIEGKKKAYQTGVYLVDGQLFYTNPRAFVPLDVEGTDLEDIVESGFLRVYRPDCGMYVYQYESGLYWIAEEDYAFADGDVYVEYQLDTTQKELLPEERLSNRWYWDNIGFMFRENELLEMNFGKYRVSKSLIPTEYSVEKIWTGRYDEGHWVWMQKFRPVYIFE